MLSLFKKKILIGHSEDTLLAIIEHIEKNNIPCEIGIKDIFERSSEVYDAFYTVKVQKKYAKQVEAIVSQYVSQEELKHWYKVEKKKSRKLERKERALYLFVFFIYVNAVGAFQTSKGLGAYNVSFIVCAVVLMVGVFMMIKYYKAMKRERDHLIFGIVLILYAVYSFISVLRL